MNSFAKYKISLKKIAKTTMLILPMLAVFTLAEAGSLSPLSAPSATSYTLEDIYNRLYSNTSATAGNHTLSTANSPAGTFYTLTQIYNAIPAILAGTVKLGTSYLGVTGILTPDGGTASVADLFNGKTSHLTADWSLDTGTLNLACNTSTFDGAGNLVANAYDGAGSGSNRWCITDSGDAVAGDILSGKIAWTDGQAVTGSIAVKSGDADASVSATSTNKLLLTPAVGYYNGSTATVSTTSTAFTEANIKSGTYLFGIVGTLTSLLYGDNNANQVLATASSPGSISVIAGNTAVASSSIQDTSFVLTVPQGYYSGANSVTVSTSSINMFVNQNLQTKDDWVNSGGTTGEYTAEEATWTTVSGSPFAGNTSINYAETGGDLDLYSGTVKKDTRTGLQWSDISAVGASASSTSNVFTLSADGSRPTGGVAVGFCDALNIASFGGHSDWYLPTQKQLMQAYIDGSANNLPNPDNFFWSSTEFYTNTANAWNVFLNNGTTYNNTKVTAFSVRCVRSS